jgi:urease beta subunit
VSLNITIIDNSTRNFKLTLSIDSVSLLKGGEIICDNSTSNNSAMAGCQSAPLTLSFINDTPRVSEYSMIADFTADREGVEITCYIPGLGKESINCSSGTFSHDFTIDQIWERNTKRYFLHIEATDPDTNKIVTLIGVFRVFGHQEKYFCTQNMINTATRPIQQGGFVEFITVGKATNFTCEIDEMIDGSLHTIPCGINVRNITALGMERKIYSFTIPNLTPGQHRLVVQPTGGCKYSVCYRPMTYIFTVAD